MFTVGQLPLGVGQLAGEVIALVAQRVGVGLEVVGRGLEIEQMEASLLSLRGELDRIEYRP